MNGFNVISIKLQNNRKRTILSTILVTLNFGILSITSNSTTQSNLNKILQSMITSPTSSNLIISSLSLSGLNTNLASSSTTTIQNNGD